ncbi:MAG: YhdH/YhfP family quinone oxidoreductase, partial [Planctomycetales bacterium]|nr:YhdH/YhfP family quinone oxidoreductase [Planctomycetales bacterium]
RCLLVEKNADGQVQRGLVDRPVDDLPAGDVLIRVRYSSLNYKDALAAGGHPGVAKRLPHVPGIDAAGVVEASGVAALPIGAEALVTGYELGSGQWGGWSQYIRVPAEWVVPLPRTLSLLDAMTLGTAGFTAAQCVMSLRQHHVSPSAGTVLVSGATGGVGSIAVALLARLGYRVAAATGKPQRHDWLRSLGAAEIVDRAAINDPSDKPLLKAIWAGAVDTVGGATLATIVRSLTHRGCVAACGLVGGTELNLSVHPFLLRGVTLDGIDSAQCPRPQREEVWRLLSGEWKLPQLDALRTVVSIEQLEPQIEAILAGRIAGRVVVEV